MGSHMLLLNWNNHKANVVGEFQQLFSRSELTDVTLVCEGFSLQAHKAVLSASSSFFRNIFLHNPCKRAFVILTDVDSDELKAIVDFMYQGQVHVSQDKLSQFLAVAKKLKIKGLSSTAENEMHGSLEEVTCNESQIQADKSSELRFLPTDASSALFSENRTQTELVFNSAVVPNCKAFCDNEQTVNSSDNLSNQSSVISETYPDINRHLNGNTSMESVPTVEDEESDSSNCRSTKYESYDNRSTSCRDEMMVSIECSKEKQPDPLYTDASFQTNRIEQLECKIDSSEVSFSVKQEQIDNACSEHDDNSICEIEPSFSLPSDHNIPDGAGCLQNQSFHAAVPSVLKETTQCSHKTFSTNGTENCPNSLREMEDPEVVAASDRLKDCQALVGSSSMPLFHINELQETGDSRKVECLKMLHFECYICQKQFADSSTLLMHQVTHTEAPPFHCDVCGKRIKTRQGMKFHMMRHTGDKPYSCNICGRKFLRQHVMETHRRIHTGERPYECNYCKKKFSDKSNLVVHTRVHTGEKPYSCHVCKRDFPQKKNLVDHLSIHLRKHQFPLS